MDNKHKSSEKLWIGVGIVVTISGVILAFENPLIGIPGALVGIWLVVVNVKKIKGKNSPY